MRVLTVGNLYPPHHLGGYELVWQEAVDYLRNRGHAVRILTTDYVRPDLPDEPRGGDDHVHRTLRWYWVDHEWPRISIGQRVRLERQNAAVLERHLEEFQPDVVAWWAMGGMSLSLIERVRRKGLPAAGVVCEEWMLYGSKVDAWLRFGSRPVLGRAASWLTGIPRKVEFDRVGPWLFPSEMLRTEAARAHHLRRTAVANQGIDRKLFPPAERPSWRWRLLYVGRIDSRKGIDLAVQALSELPSGARLDVVGTGHSAYLRELRDLAAQRELADRVRFHGAVPRARLRDRYAEADVLVFPARWREPWGLVPLEAMAVGTPVIATGRGGSGEYLRQGENCLIFDPDRGAPDLASAVATLARDEELRARLRDGGFATADAIPAGSFNAAVEAMLSRAIAERA